MPKSISRRVVLGAAATLPAAAILSARLASAAPSATVSFTLDATTLDGGEQVTSVTLHAKSLGNIDPASLSVDTFSVHAKATSPVPIDVGDVIFNIGDTDRDVTGTSIDAQGNITLQLFTLDGTTPGTLGYIRKKGRNVQLVLDYTITQNKPLKLQSQRDVTIASFTQGNLINAEVDAFDYGVSAGGTNYRLFSPTNDGQGRADKHPLIVWLHGGGEGGMGEWYDNEAPLRANRGALGFATDEGQQIFGGAYVVAPQSESAWLNDGAKFAPELMALIEELLAADRNIDPDRIHVVGCSNGGYMTLKMASVYPDYFASGVPICCAATPNLFTDEELRRVSSTPTWFVHSKNDTTLPYIPNTIRAAELIDGEIVTLYDEVKWDGISYAGHWSWIYVANNDPSHKGQHLYQWMAKQTTATPSPTVTSTPSPTVTSTATATPTGTRPGLPNTGV